jgi:hypothetical protein
VPPSPSDDQRTALDVAAVTVHWMAGLWSRAAPGVAARLRTIADRLSTRAAHLRRREFAAQLHDEDPLDPVDPFGDHPTDKVTLPYGSPEEPPK